MPIAYYFRYQVKTTGAIIINFGLCIHFVCRLSQTAFFKFQFLKRGREKNVWLDFLETYHKYSVTQVMENVLLYFPKFNP